VQEYLLKAVASNAGFLQLFNKFVAEVICLASSCSSGWRRCMMAMHRSHFTTNICRHYGSSQVPRGPQSALTTTWSTAVSVLTWSSFCGNYIYQKFDHSQLRPPPLLNIFPRSKQQAEFLAPADQAGDNGGRLVLQAGAGGRQLLPPGGQIQGGGIVSWVVSSSLHEPELVPVHQGQPGFQGWGWGLL
jgi:hypothetical protein